MMIDNLLPMAIATSFGLLNINSLAQAQPEQDQYLCVIRQGRPTTLIQTGGKTIEFIVWQRAQVMSCEEVSARFQRLSDHGELEYITTGTLSGNNVICAADPLMPQAHACKKNGLLLNLNPTIDPQGAMMKLFASALKNQSHGAGEVECNFVENSTIAMKKFLECAVALQGNSHSQNSDFSDSNGTNLPENTTNSQPKFPSLNNDLETDPFFW